MEKIYNNLSIENLKKTEWFNQFNENQKHRIIKGLNDNLDVSIYANPKFDVYQMKLLLTALSKNLDISHCLNEKLDRIQMNQIIKGLENNVDVSIYAKPEISWQEMEEIRLELLKRKNKEG